MDENVVATTNRNIEAKIVILGEQSEITGFVTLAVKALHYNLLVGNRCRENEFCCRLQSGRQQRNEEKTELCQFHHWCLFCHGQGESARQIGQNAGGCVSISVPIRWFILWELFIDMGHCGTREVQVDGPTLLQEGQRSCGHV